MLSDMYPEHKKTFFRLSKQRTGFARILQGVHYASDNRASEMAVEKLYPLIKEYYHEQDSHIVSSLQVQLFKT